MSSSTHEIVNEINSAAQIQKLWSAHEQRDHITTITLAEKLRNDFPNEEIAYQIGAAAHRQLANFTQANALLRDAIHLFSEKLWPWLEYAWLAIHSGDYEDAIQRANELRMRFPEEVYGYHVGAVAYRELKRYDQAENLLWESICKFPNDSAPLLEAARIAYDRQQSTEVIRLADDACARFPEIAVGYKFAFLGRLMERRAAEAEIILKEMISKFPMTEWSTLPLDLEHSRAYLARDLALEQEMRESPENQDIILAYAIRPTNELEEHITHGGIKESIRRLYEVILKYPDFDEARFHLVRLLLLHGAAADAEQAFLSQPYSKLSQDYRWALLSAKIAEAQCDVATLITRLERARNDFPLEEECHAELALVFENLGRYHDAEGVLTHAIAIFPSSPRLLEALARLELMRGNPLLAHQKVIAALQLFPTDINLLALKNDIQVELEYDPTSLITSTTADITTEIAQFPELTPYEVLTAFQNLGGESIGCEFSFVQRNYGVEPIGLFRWSGTSLLSIEFLLNTEFAPLLSPKNYIFSSTSDGEIILSFRGLPDPLVMHLGMRINGIESTSENAREELVYKRITFLIRKLIVDLRRGKDIFVYKYGNASFDRVPLERISTALRAYGESVLLIVDLETENHSSGLVEWVQPNIMMGYLDSLSGYIFADGQAAPMNDWAFHSWLNLCTAALKLSRNK